MNPKHAVKSFYIKRNLLLAALVSTVIIFAAFIIPSGYIASAEESDNASYPEWQEAGYQSLDDYHSDLKDKAEGAKDAYKEFDEKYGSVATEEQKEEAKKLCALMAAPASINLYEKDKAALDKIKEECDRTIAQMAYNSRSYSSATSYTQPSGNGVLTRSNGSNGYNGHRETWYSIHEAGQTQTAYAIPGKHIGDDGIIRDKDGYVCVASGHHKAYEVVETSRGTGKVYDICGTDAIDVYTAW